MNDLDKSKEQLIAERDAAQDQTAKVLSGRGRWAAELLRAEIADARGIGPQAWRAAADWLESKT